MKSWRKKNRKIEQEEEKKEENKKGAGYCVRKARNNQPSQKFLGVRRSVELLCRLARRMFVRSEN
jgi:hypothetical protein